MADAKKNKKKNLKLAIIIAIVLILILILLIVITRKGKKAPQTTEELAKIDAEYQEKRNEEIRRDLYGKTEQERMQYYCANFFRLIDSNNYEKAYELLYSDYKENYFPNINNFKRYFQEYFPSDFGLAYNNMERLGDIYVLRVTVKDTVNGSFGHNFDMYVVIKENAVNDYVISFSRNSAVEVEEEEIYDN